MKLIKTIIMMLPIITAIATLAAIITKQNAIATSGIIATILLYSIIRPIEEIKNDN